MCVCVSSIRVLSLPATFDKIGMGFNVCVLVHVRVLSQQATYNNTSSLTYLDLVCICVCVYVWTGVCLFVSSAVSHSRVSACLGKHMENEDINLSVTEIFVPLKKKASKFCFPTDLFFWEYYIVLTTLFQLSSQYDWFVAAFLYFIIFFVLASHCCY